MHLSPSRLLATTLTLLPLTNAECTRAALLQTVDEYLQGLSMGQAGPLQNIADDFLNIENNKTIPIVSGIIGNILKIDYNHTIVDMLSCATFTELVSSHSEKPWVIGTQIRHHPVDNSVYLIDSVVSTTGDWFFNASKTLHFMQNESWAPLDKPESRTTLLAAADAYLDMWTNATAEAAVPWGTPCDRLEGSAYTGQGLMNDTCRVGVPTNHAQKPNSGRRYVVDESVGAVSVLCVFEHMSPDAADSHLFRLEGGRLRFVHTITRMSSAGVGNPYPPSARRG
ncbi:hypothetical protein B0T19DRAFT_357607 [Cercophora scortea]|uniref:DUF8021 domain-containing protein n=1 Tax=Cercophora scortea TaxID=314031 RepID=A0AAE0IKY0_9PEZI|nr:hypothetical protein B0T19DRAFT_357607 [Cercophora scortea]